MFGPKLTLKQFYNVYWRRSKGEKLMLPRGMDQAFMRPQTDEEHQIRDLIEQHRAQEAQSLTELIFQQKTRLHTAERMLEEKVTKKATDDVRIATKKIAAAQANLANVRRSEPRPSDGRIFPDWYSPVMVVEAGERVLMPMRYHCLPAGRPAFFDVKYPGTFNARRDSLEKYWKGVFGVSHGVVIVDAFYENVTRHDEQGKPYNVILEFTPDHHQPMIIACLWSRWTAPDQPDLLSWAAITDEPPAEVAAAGHDRCIIPLKPENVEAWLNPDPKNLAASYALLDDRQAPYYEHRLAMAA